MSRITLQRDETSDCFRLQSKGGISVLRLLHDNAKGLSDIDLIGASPTGGACDLQPIRAHKNILAQMSSRMFDLFTVDSVVDSSKLTHIFTAIDHASLRSIIQFLYTGTVDVQEIGAVERVRGILIAAEHLNLKELAEACEKFLANNDRIDGQNCIDVFQFAFKYNCTVLLGAVCGFIAKNLLANSKSTKFLGLTQDEFAKFLLSKSAVVANADDRCRAAIAWLNHKSPSRASSVECIMNMASLDADGVKPETLLLAARSVVIRPTIKRGTLTAIDAMASSMKRTSQMESKQSKHKKQKSNEAGAARGEAWYVVGGRENAKAFYRYDVAQRQWSTLQDLPWERQYGGVCAVGKRLFVMGGVKCGRLVSTIDEYDTVIQTWSTSRAKLKCARKHVAVAADSRYAYAFGGCDADGEEAYNAAERYSVESTKLKGLTNMEAERFQAAAVCKNDMVFVVGGVSECKDDVDFMCTSVDKYDHATRKWSEVVDSEKFGWSTGAAFLGDDLYIAGGCLDTKAVQILNTETGKIRSGGELVYVRDGCSAVPLDRHVMCVMGGRSSSVRHSSVETYDTRTKKWSVGVVSDMPEALSYFGLAHVHL